MLMVKSYAQDAAISRVFKSFFKCRNHWVINLLELSICEALFINNFCFEEFLKNIYLEEIYKFFFCIYYMLCIIIE